MKPEYIEVSSYEEVGYKPVIDYMEWRVAILNYIDELEIQNIETMQKHNETDEVFVLLKGNCKLFTGGNGDIIGEIDAIQMEPLKLYNVKRGVWHTHTLDFEGSVLIVENRNTCDDNSPKLPLSMEQKEKLYQV
jgi:hypothetical protein